MPMNREMLEPLRHIGIFGYSMQMCRLLLLEMKENGLFGPHQQKNQPYYDAQVRMLIDDPGNIEKYLSKWFVHYRNHELDKKGRLTKCEAYLKERI